MQKIFKNFDSDASGCCDYCGLEVYGSDEIYIIDGFIICDECFGNYTQDYFSCCKTYGETLRRRKDVT